jgi:dipeptidyl aminopeptidase/acylaminoacyl peptidase
MPQVVEHELSPEGPWLVGFGTEAITALNTDGTGETTLVGPPLWQPRLDVVLGDGVSSSGWIAARTGTRNDWNLSQHSTPEGAVPPSELGIALWRLPDREPYMFIPRFSRDLLAGMGEIGDFKLMYDEQVTGPRWKHDTVFVSLLHEDARLFWSPDGRHLAFAAALDGPSADVYVFDTRLDQIRRLTDGPSQAVLLGWSPDSQWILHYEATQYRSSHGEIIGFPAEVLWAAKADGSQILQFGSGEGKLAKISGWLSPNSVVLTARLGGPSLSTELWSIDIETGIRRERRDLNLYSIAVDPGGDTIAVNADSLIDPEGGYLEGGLFVLQSVGGNLEEIGDGPSIFCYGCPIEWVERIGSFIAHQPFNFGNEVRPPFRFLPTGEVLTVYEGEVSRPIVSPDGTWLAFPGDGVRIYAESGGLQLSLPGTSVSSMVWSPDSAGLYYLEATDGAVRLRYGSVPQGGQALLNPEIGLEGLHLVRVGDD